uniref:Lysosomal acid phosphatase n=1 Tax=Caenorhabditis tropicalis TaxID=1561998 RepID=A0A1I7ULT8_9PELO
MIYRLLFLYFSIVHAELEMVQVLVRHGDRAPSFTYPLDEKSFDVNRHFPRGYSQLTKQGFDQAKEVGRFLRNRYEGLIDGFNRKETLIRSSDKDRCIETAMGITRTLFPDDFVPVHTFSHYKHDLLLKPNSVFCRRVEEIVNDETKELSALVDKKYKDLFSYLSQKTGWEVDGSRISDVFNVLHRKYSNRVPQPEWVDYVLSNVTELKRQFRSIQFNSDEKTKMRTGYLLGQITKVMIDRNGRKLIVYSTHDATVTSLMYSLGISDHQLVPYTAALIVELHRIDGKQFVKILYRNSTTSPPREMRIPGCEILCPMQKYMAFVSNRIVSGKEEHDILCQNHVATPVVSSLPHQILPEEDHLFSTLITVGSLSYFDLFSSLKMKN